MIRGVVIQKNSKTNIMVVGANGIIGSCLVNHFENHAELSMVGYGNGSGLLNYFGDLIQESVSIYIAEKCSNPEILIFLVGLAHAKGKGRDLPEFEKVNYKTLVNLLTALNAVGKTPDKIIFASTVSVYGERYSQNRYNETLEPNPFSPYAVTKLKAEKYLLDNFGNKSWILRFAPVYSYNFLLNINRRTKLGNRFYKIGKGVKKLSLCNIENIMTTVEGIIDGNVPVGVYNISDPVAYSYNDLLNHQRESFVFRVPIFAIRLLYILGRITKNIFLKENSTKLITDNIFPSDKIQKYIKLNHTISDLKIIND